MNGYELSRYWFDWAFENPDLINSNDTALYMWLVEKNNRCGWSDKFSVTASESMGACGFKTYPPYKKSFDRLIEFGFIIMVKKSINQHQSNVIALSKNDKAIVKALDKASLTQSIKHVESNSKSTFDINKQETIKQETENKETLFESLWAIYPTKRSKQESLKKFLKLTNEEVDKVKIHLPIFSKIKEFETYTHPHLTTYFNQKRFNDEITDVNKLKPKQLWVEVLLNHTYKDMIKSEYLKAVKEGYINCDNPIIIKEYYK